LSILGLLLLFGVVARLAYYFYLNPPSIGTTASTTPTDVNVPDRTHGSVLYLDVDRSSVNFSHRGRIAGEMLRQAMLIAARDELGLQTRDGSLREWRDTPPAGQTLEMDFQGTNVSLRFNQSQVYVRWQREYPDNRWPKQIPDLVDLAEKMSRGEFVAVLRKDGWSGGPNAVKADAPAPADCGARLMEMEELSQYAVLRDTSLAIRNDGESLARLGALVRAYSNLGQLTRYHWSVEYAVYTARSLLYAQRMVAKNPDSQLAFWHRAYAEAMAGLKGPALNDLKAAKELSGRNPPKWVIPLEPFCRYQTGKLVDLSAGDPEISGLGMYLALLTVEQSGSQGAVMNIAQAAMKVNPNCFRIMDVMCDQTGPGMLNELTEQAPQTFSAILAAKLEAQPGFPKDLTDRIGDFRKAADPSGRETICLGLIDQGTSDRDRAEPSWAALGRLVQETTFAHVLRKAYLIAEGWGVDAGDYVNSVQSRISDHPYKMVVDYYGMRHQANIATLQKTWRVSDLLEKQAGLRYWAVYRIEGLVQEDGPQTGHNYWLWQLLGADDNSIDIEQMLWNGNTDASAEWKANALAQLGRVSPHSPMLMTTKIHDAWDATKAKDWEAEHGDFPSVALALGTKYSDLHQWADAERCLRKYIAVSPDYAAYEALAKIYRNQGKDDRWLATLNEYLGAGQDFGLQDANVQVEIANYLMTRHDYRRAMPYADLAAETGAGWATRCDVAAHTGIGDFAAAEQMLAEERDHYSESPYAWYFWCTRTRHGELQAAKTAMGSLLAKNPDDLTDEELIEIACYDLANDKNDAALSKLRQRLKLFPGAISALHIALIEDETHHPVLRDEMLEQIHNLPNPSWPMALFAGVLQQAIKAGPRASPDPAAIEAIVKDAAGNDRISIYALTGWYLANRGKTAEATEYYKRCATLIYSVDQLWVDAQLKHGGIDAYNYEMGQTNASPVH
jgi:tetratricopeptide (TPR) repeat protein